MSEKKDYTFRVIWSEEDNSFIGLCDEFPDLSWSAPTQEGALMCIQYLVEAYSMEKRSLSELYGVLPVDKPLPDIHELRRLRGLELGQRIHDGEE